MSRVVRIPRLLHDVLGRTQTLTEVTIVTLAAVVVGAVSLVAGEDTLSTVPAWRGVLASVLIVDIAAGCVANFTRGTDRYYAERPANRWVFIAVHWHLVAVGALLALEMVPLLVVTAYTLTAACAVNLVGRDAMQVTVGGSLMIVGIVGVVLWLPLSSPDLVVATAALFVLKVVFSFAVTHHPADAGVVDGSAGR